MPGKGSPSALRLLATLSTKSPTGLSSGSRKPKKDVAYECDAWIGNAGLLSCRNGEGEPGSSCSLPVLAGAGTPGGKKGLLDVAAMVLTGSGIAVEKKATPFLHFFFTMSSHRHGRLRSLAHWRRARGPSPHQGQTARRPLSLNRLSASPSSTITLTHSFSRGWPRAHSSWVGSECPTPRPLAHAHQQGLAQGLLDDCYLVAPLSTPSLTPPASRAVRACPLGAVAR